MLRKIELAKTKKSMSDLIVNDLILFDLGISVFHYEKMKHMKTKETMETLTCPPHNMNYKSNQRRTST